MAVPSRINDGNWAIAMQAGAPEVEMPFADEGDTYTFVITVPFMQDQANYVPLRNFLNPVTGIEALVPYTSIGRTVYLVKETQATPIDMTSGILKWNRVYATIPRTRKTKGSIVYQNQFASSQNAYSWPDEPVQVEVGEFPLIMDCTFKYEYSIGSPLPALNAPKVTSLFGRLIKIGGWGNLVAGSQVLALDTESRIYMGSIYERKSTTITWPTWE